ncbi:MAG: hypothetical protein CSA35_02105 [Dethiosulfovibrio peptidovorans]|nr:MAG: hypothetical protein CSA35_02105 [Dethiosulfovibrio peptidovorans]
MKKKCLLTAILTMAFWTWSGVLQAADFTVTNFTPQGKVSGKPVLQVTFSSPVVPTSLLGKILPADQVPLVIRPRLEGYAVWDSPDRLVYTTAKPVAPATEYQVTFAPLRDQSGHLLAGPQLFSFRTAPLTVKMIRPVELSPRRELTLEFHFSLPVPPQRLLGFLSAKSGGSLVQLRPQGQVPAKTVRVVSAPLRGKSLSVTVAKGLTSDVGPLGLVEARTESFPVAKGTQVASPVTITGTSVESLGPDRARLFLYTSRPVAPDDVMGFVSVSPERNFRIECTYNGFALVGAFSPRDRVAVTIRKGLGGVNGLVEDETRTFVLPDMDRSASFPATGTFLSPLDSPRVPLDTVNLDQVQVSAWKLYPNNIPLVMGALGTESGAPLTLTKFMGTWSLPVNNRLNHKVCSALDLSDLLGESRGVFLLEAKDSDQWWGGARQMVTVTDLGVSVRLGEKGILVWVNGLSDGRPVGKAAVSVFSSSNQRLAHGTTDRNGLWSVKRDQEWDPQLRPAVVVVERDEDMSFVALSGNGFADDRLDISGAPWVTTYEADCILPRGIFRPGETVDVTSLVRGPRLALPGTFPLVWRVYNSLGVHISQGRSELSRNGLTTCAFDLPPATPMGQYCFDLLVPGKEEVPLGRASFLVEDFTPPTIELSLKADGSQVMASQAVGLSFDAAYLFGAPSPGLNWELRGVTSPRRYESRRFPGFRFGDDRVSFQKQELDLDSGTLDDSGRWSLNWTVPDNMDAPSMVDINLSLRVMEPGGRWVGKTLSLPCHLAPFHLGVRSPDGEITPGQPVSFQVAGVTSADEVAEGSVDWTLYSLVVRPVLVRESGRTRMVWQEEQTAVASGDTPLKDGLGTCSVIPEDEGNYLLTLDGGVAHVTSSVRFSAWKSWGASRSGAVLPDRVELSLDKDRYAPGERAVLSYRAPFPGMGLFTFEAEEILVSKVVSITKPEGTLDFVVDKRVWPNGWCTFQVIRPVTREGDWAPHRALGAVSLIVNEGAPAKVAVQVPDQVEPGQLLPLKVSVTDTDGRPADGDLWVALVDRGILGLTDHQVPDPWKLFSAQRRLATQASDIYDELMPLESRETPVLHPAGGEAQMAYGAMNLSPLEARGFKVLAMVRPDLSVQDGVAEVSFDLPEFSGGVKAMAVFSGSSVGSAWADISIARPVTVDPTVPQALAPGDRFTVPVQVISTADSDLNLKLVPSSWGTLSLPEGLSWDVTVPARGNVTLDLPVVAARNCGPGGVDLAVSGAGLDFQLSRETVVRPPMPRVTVTGGSAVKPGTFSVPSQDDWFPGTLRASCFVSGSPRSDLLPVVAFLNDYPYTCLEQTVSKAWPLVALPNMARKLNSRLAGNRGLTDALRAVVAKLQILQLYDGSFAMWPGGTQAPWASLYAAHFLASLQKGLVPDAMVNRTGSYLRSVLSEMADDSYDLSRKAYACYILTLWGQPPMGWMAWLNERIGGMTQVGRLFLAAAYGAADKKEEGRRLLGGTSSGTVAVETYGSALRDKALALLATSAVAPDSAEETTAARAVVAELAADRLSTQSAGWAVLTMGRFFERVDVKPFSAVVSNGTTEHKLSTGDELALSSDHPVPWTVTNRGPGTVFCNWTYSGVPTKSVPPYDQGVSIRRVFRDAKGAPLDLSKPLTFGQEIQVCLEVIPTGTVQDLVVVDVLPGCFQVWNPPVPLGEAEIAPRREVRFDRVLFFPTKVNGRLILKYGCRATTRGTFTLPPVSAQAMFAPSVRSLSGGGTVTVR